MLIRRLLHRYLARFTIIVLLILLPMQVLAGPPDDSNVTLPPLSIGGPAHSSEANLWQGWTDWRVVGPPASDTLPSLVGPQSQQNSTAADSRLGTWLQATFNPGKWVGEAVIGSMAAMIEAIAAMVWEVVSRAMGRSITAATTNDAPRTVATAGCAPSASDPLSNWLLCHPVDSLLSDTGTGSPGWTIARTQEIGTGLLGVAALVLLVRLLLRLRTGQLSALTEDGMMALLLGYAGMRLYPTLIRLAMESTNQLTNAFAGAGSYDRLYALVEAASNGYSLSLTLALCILVLGLTLLYLVVLAVIRLAELALLVVLGPLALVSYAAGNAFGLWSTWLRRLAGNLLTTAVWALGLAFGTNWLWLITGVSSGVGIGDQVMTAFIGSIIVLATAELPALLGVRSGSPLGYVLLPLLGGWAPAAQLRKLDRALLARNPHAAHGASHDRNRPLRGRSLLPALGGLTVARALQDAGAGDMSRRGSPLSGSAQPGNSSPGRTTTATSGATGGIQGTHQLRSMTAAQSSRLQAVPGPGTTQPLHRARIYPALPASGATISNGGQTRS